MKNELTEYKQLYDTDSSRGPKDSILCRIDSGPLVFLCRRFDYLRQEGYKIIDFKMQATLSKGKQNMIYKINRQSGKRNFKKTEAYSLFIIPKCI